MKFENSIDKSNPNHLKNIKMCSESEITERWKSHNLSFLEADKEKSYYDKKSKKHILFPNNQFCIKSFKRSNQSDENDFIRSPEQLFESLNYIINNLVDFDLKPKQDYYNFDNIEYSSVFSFILDRIRSIRKDFIILNQKDNPYNIECHEKIVRYYIICLNQCLDYKDFINDRMNYKHIIDQLNGSLAYLRECYQFNKNSENSANLNKNECEFNCYSIIISLSDEVDTLTLLSKLKLDSKYNHSVKSIVKAYFSNDYVEFFKIMKKSEYLISCLMNIYSDKMRKVALDIISMNKRLEFKYKVNLNFLLDLLCFNDVCECADFFHWYGMDFDENFFENPGKKFYLFKEFPEKSGILLEKCSNQRIIEIKALSFTRNQIILR